MKRRFKRKEEKKKTWKEGSREIKTQTNEEIGEGKDYSKVFMHTMNVLVLIMPF